MVGIKPPYVMAALAKSHYSNPGIKETGAFSINIPSTSMAEVTDYCGMVSGRKYDKSNGVPSMGKIDPLILSVPEMTYVRLGSPVGRK